MCGLLERGVLVAGRLFAGHDMTIFAP